MSKPPLPPVVLDETLIQKLTGDPDVSDAREIVARGMNINSLDLVSLGRHSWDHLEVLSLSQNKLGSVVWGWLQQCHSLKSLNLNFCDINTLDGVESLPDLEKLYLSANKVADLTPLRSCTKLNTLSLYRNAVEDLEGAVSVLEALPELADLDLSGNPVWFKPECKHRCVLGIGSLRRYDDEDLSELDCELAEEFAEGGDGAMVAALERARGRRPATAPLDQGGEAAGGGGAAAGDAAGTGAMAIPQSTRAGERPKSEQSSDGSGSFNTVELGSAGGSFVQRLRKSTTLLSDPVTRLQCEATIPSLENCLVDPANGVERLYAVVQVTPPHSCTSHRQSRLTAVLIAAAGAERPAHGGEEGARPKLGWFKGRHRGVAGTAEGELTAQARELEHVRL